MFQNKHAAEITHIPTGETPSLDSYKFRRRLDSLSVFTGRTDNPHLFNNGDAVRVKFPTANNGGAWSHDWKGIVRGRNLRDRTFTAYDYGSILALRRLSFDRERFIGSDPFMAALEIVEQLDAYDMIDTGQIHGSGLGKVITYEDRISASNETGWAAILKILAKFSDDSGAGSGYSLPLHAWFDGGDRFQLEVRADIEDAAGFPGLAVAYRTDIIDIGFKASTDAAATVCTCRGGDGAEITVEDSTVAQYAASDGDFRYAHAVIDYDSPHLDELRARAVDYLLQRRDPPAEYAVEMGDALAVPLNSVLDITAEELGIDGRFLVAGVDVGSGPRSVVTVSGQRMTLADLF